MALFVKYLISPKLFRNICLTNIKIISSKIFSLRLYLIYMLSDYYTITALKCILILGHMWKNYHTILNYTIRIYSAPIESHAHTQY